MNDRVVDRAAAHATPAELAVRDWLLVGLSLATGIYEAICFLTFGDLMLRHAHRSAPVVPAVLNGPHHRDRLGGPEAACHLRPGR